MELIWEELGTKFKDLLEMGRSGVIASLMAASHRLHTHDYKVCYIRGSFCTYLLNKIAKGALSSSHGQSTCFSIVCLFGFSSINRSCWLSTLISSLTSENYSFSFLCISVFDFPFLFDSVVRLLPLQFVQQMTPRHVSFLGYCFLIVTSAAKINPVGNGQPV